MHLPHSTYQHSPLTATLNFFNDKCPPSCHCHHGSSRACSSPLPDPITAQLIRNALTHPTTLQGPNENGYRQVNPTTTATWNALKDASVEVVACEAHCTFNLPHFRHARSDFLFPSFTSHWATACYLHFLPSFWPGLNHERLINPLPPSLPNKTNMPRLIIDPAPIILVAPKWLFYLSWSNLLPDHYVYPYTSARAATSPATTTDHNPDGADP